METTECSCCGESRSGWVALHCHDEIKICDACLDWLQSRREAQQRAHTGGWMVAGFEPVFTVADVARATDHYTRLGFEIHSRDRTYAFAHRDRHLTIRLTEADPNHGPRPGTLYIHCHDADEVAGEWRRAGLHVEGPQDDDDYGTREGSHVDPDGNRLRFGSPLRAR